MPGNLDLALRIRADLGNVRQQLDRLEREVRGVGAATQRTGRQAAGGAAGVDQFGRGALRARREARRAAQGVTGLGTAARSAAGGVGRLGDEAESAADDIEQVDKSSERAGRGLRRLDVGVAAFGANLASGALARGVQVLAEIPGAIVDAGLEIERLEQQFNFASGSIAGGAQELQFVRQEAERVGISFTAAAGGYSSLLAASRGTNVGIAETRELFLGIAEASAVLRLSQDEVAGALRAVQQIMSKGTLQAEEIRGQLGERIPGAFQIAARAMGVTTAELNKMLELGQVLSEDFLPKFGRQLRKEFGEAVPDAADSAAASFARMDNALERLEQAVATSGLLDFLAEAADLASGLLDSLSGVRVRTVAEDLARLGELQQAQDRLLAQAGGGRLQPRARRQFQDLQRDIEAVEARIVASGIAGAEALRGVAERAREEVEDVAAELAELRAATEARTGETGRRGAQQRVEDLSRIEELEVRLDEATRRRIAAERLAREATDALDLSEVPQTPRFRQDDETDAAAEKRRERVLAITQQQEDGILRIQNRRIALSLVQERRLVEEVEAALEERAVSEEEAQAAIAAIRTRGAAERAKFDDEELEGLRRTAEAAVRAEERRQRAAERRRQQEARALRQARGELAELERELLDPYDRAVAEVEAWRAATIAAFEAAGVSAEEYGAIVEQVYRERIANAAKEAADAQLRESKRAIDGARRGLAEYAAEAADVGTQVENATVNALKGMEDALTQFVTTGKLEFSDLVNSIVADLARIAIRSQITGPLASALFSALGGGGSPADFGFTTGGIGHSGGIAGQLTRRRPGLPAQVFAGAPRLHQGGLAGRLRPNEVPAILQRGEGVFTPEQMRALGGGVPAELKVEITNTGGEPIEAREARATFDPARWVVSVVVGNIAQDAEIAQQVRGIMRQGAR